MSKDQSNKPKKIQTERKQTKKKDIQLKDSNKMKEYQQIPLTEENVAKINTLLPLHKYIRIRQWINFIDEFDV